MNFILDFVCVALGRVFETAVGTAVLNGFLDQLSRQPCASQAAVCMFVVLFGFRWYACRRHRLMHNIMTI